MEYDYLLKLKDHPTLKLLAADSAPLIISFFHLAFIKTNQRAICSSEIISVLDDYLYHLRQIHGQELFPRPAKEYLDIWADSEHGFLRKYYPAKGDEPEYDLTPSSEKVIEWLSSLEQKQFVGTESRLLTIFRLLREIVNDTATDPEDQIQQLLQQKADIEAQITQLKHGLIRPRDKTRIREKFLQAEETARHLLFDFRQIEENFRQLDRKTRQRIATSDLPKGQLLDAIFGEEDAIKGSDQGRSFSAFWTYLMSPASQSELDQLMQQVLHLSEIKDIPPDQGMDRLRFRLLSSGEKVNETCALLVEQLRKFLDDQAWFENRRIMSIIREIEKKGATVDQALLPKQEFIDIPDIRPDIALPMARGLFSPPRRPVIDDKPDLGIGDFKTPALYNQHYVDERILQDRVRNALRGKSQISLVQLCKLYPIEKGLSEVIAYLHMACKDDLAVVDTQTTEVITWQDSDGQARRVHMPQVIFTH